MGKRWLLDAKYLFNSEAEGLKVPSESRLGVQGQDIITPLRPMYIPYIIDYIPYTIYRVLLTVATRLAKAPYAVAIAAAAVLAKLPAQGPERSAGIIRLGYQRALNNGLMVSVRTTSPIWYMIYTYRPPNVPLLRAIWSLLDGIWGLLKGSWRGDHEAGVVLYGCFL